jgi:hypothetical protein
MEGQTFRNSQEPQQDHTVAVCTAHIVVNVPDGHVQWPILVVACCHRNCCFVAAENYRDKHRPMVVRILSNNILQCDNGSMVNQLAKIYRRLSYSMFPGPISGHKILEPMVAFRIVFLNG